MAGSTRPVWGEDLMAAGSTVSTGPPTVAPCGFSAALRSFCALPQSPLAPYNGRLRTGGRRSDSVPLFSGCVEISSQSDSDSDPLCWGKQSVRPRPRPNSSQALSVRPGSEYDRVGLRPGRTPTYRRG
eukprot:gene9157-biopygen13741